MKLLNTSVPNELFRMEPLTEKNRRESIRHENRDKGLVQQWEEDKQKNGPK